MKTSALTLHDARSPATPGTEALCPSQAIPLWTRSWRPVPLGASALPHPCILPSLSTFGVWRGPWELLSCPLGVLRSHHCSSLPLSPTISPTPTPVFQVPHTAGSVQQNLQSQVNSAMWCQWTSDDQAPAMVCWKRTCLLVPGSFIHL